MADITVLLAAILAAKKGEEVRGSIHDAIELCYQDGKAGASDLQARQLIEAVAEVNEQQQAALEVLQARVEELESGEGGSSQQSTTIDIPTVLVDGGVVESLNVNNNGTTTYHITFTTPFTEAPKVMVAIGKNAGAVSQYGYLSANILYPTITTTGFDFFLANRTGSDRSPGVVWYAYQPTVKTIDLDITIPETEGMTEAQVRAITGPIAAAVDALKTGYDGTTYQTAAEAVRTQINDLHVLIGDEPGTAISADSIGYEDGSVADALAGLNGRLDQLDGGLTADVKAALLACFAHVAWDSADPTGQSYITALQNALYPPANLSRITAVYTQSGTVWTTDTLDSLKSDLVVTAYYSDNTSEVVSNYTLSGTLSEGTRTITVAYGGKTATFTVVVSEYSTAPVIVTEGVVWSKTPPNTVAKEGFGITKWYDYTFSQENIESSRYWDETNQYMTTSGWSGIVIYTPDTNTYEGGYTWPASGNFKHVGGLDGVYKNNTSITRNSVINWGFIRQSAVAVTNNGVSFSIPLLDADDCYAYWHSSAAGAIYPEGVSDGDIIFAGQNTPYFGMHNISEAET